MLDEQSVLMQCKLPTLDQPTPSFVEKQQLKFAKA